LFSDTTATRVIKAAGGLKEILEREDEVSSMVSFWKEGVSKPRLPSECCKIPLLFHKITTRW
jgi:hypothetical protein